MSALDQNPEMDGDKVSNNAWTDGIMMDLSQNANLAHQEHILKVKIRTFVSHAKRIMHAFGSITN